MYWLPLNLSDRMSDTQKKGEKCLGSLFKRFLLVNKRSLKLLIPDSVVAGYPGNGNMLRRGI